MDFGQLSKSHCVRSTHKAQRWRGSKRGSASCLFGTTAASACRDDAVSRRIHYLLHQCGQDLRPPLLASDCFEVQPRSSTVTPAALAVSACCDPTGPAIASRSSERRFSTKSETDKRHVQQESGEARCRLPHPPAQHRALAVVAAHRSVAAPLGERFQQKRRHTACTAARNRVRFRGDHRRPVHPAAGRSWFCRCAPACMHLPFMDLRFSIVATLLARCDSASFRPTLCAAMAYIHRGDT